MQNLFIVAAGGALGASARHLFNLAAARWLGLAFPWGTLGVNLLGGFLLGLLVGLLAHRIEMGGSLRLFLTTGVLGGFTTFSAFSLDAVVLWERGAHALAGLYVVASVAGAIVALLLGMWLARSVG